MEDNVLLNLYNTRDESAISETASKYGNYCLKIAMNILCNREDSDECVNDTWLKAWNSIPPSKPSILSAFLGRITRNLSIDAFQKAQAKKRGGGELNLIFDELEQCLSSKDNTESEYDRREVGKSVSDFLNSLSKDNRVVFVRRYWYADSVAEIAQHFKMNENKVKSILYRTRNKLKLYLEKEGITI
ncbi:MAG: sigma-70 family RNA polymerase sigma factor [Oscillospiraceae bacterium]|nr:sigma-70 family RNA polymerase sigma factor [Oscillospiraceae bacterium]